MQTSYAGIATIGFDAGCFGKICFRFAEQFEIMLFAGCKCRADIRLSFLSTNICVFIVCRFFLPLYRFCCFFWGVRTEFRLHQPTPLHTVIAFN
jgi:hypothetical protein